jgi:DNA-directed RNA polymerase sigma subunit (sigma70/sigma32)
MHPLAIIFRIMHISRKMRRETGRDPTPQEVAEKCSIRLENVRKVFKITKEPILLENPYV